MTVEHSVPLDEAADAAACNGMQPRGAGAASTGRSRAAARRARARASGGSHHGPGLLGSLRALGRTRRSAVAMEMAAVALPFCMLLLGTFEVAFDLYVQSAMNLAMGEAARAVWIG